jgi:hypothetical protein
MSALLLDLPWTQARRMVHAPWTWSMEFLVGK